MALDGFVISNIVYELNQTILNAKISKIAQPENDELLFESLDELGELENGKSLYFFNKICNLLRHGMNLR